MMFILLGKNFQGAALAGLYPKFISYVNEYPTDFLRDKAVLGKKVNMEAVTFRGGDIGGNSNCPEGSTDSLCLVETEVIDIYSGQVAGAIVEIKVDSKANFAFQMPPVMFKGNSFIDTLTCGSAYLSPAISSTPE